MFNLVFFKVLIFKYDDEMLGVVFNCFILEMYVGIKECFLIYGLDNLCLSMYNWLLYCKDIGKLIGDFFYYIIFCWYLWVEIGYSLYDMEDCGQGFMQELLLVILKFGFEEFGLE